MSSHQPSPSGNHGNSFFNPTKLLKKGLNGLASPIVMMKDMVIENATPRATFGTTGSTWSTPGSTNRGTAMPSPAEYPSLFNVDASSSMNGIPPSGPSSRTSSRETSVKVRKAMETSDLDEDTRVDLQHHNLHSILMNPKGNHWSGAILDVLIQNPLEADLPIPTLSLPGLDLLVSARDFEPYLKKHGKHAKRYEENHVLPVEQQLSSSQVPSIAIADQDVATCFQFVPSLFFRPDFDLTDPGMFEQVMSMPTTTLQEDLTKYLDRVEYTLLRQVSSRSDRFFEASANQEVMKQSITVACDQVSTLRTTMDRLRNGLADKSLDIVSLHRRQKRMAELHEVVTMIESVKTAESTIDALIQCQEYTNALDMMEKAQETLREHLKGIHGLSTLSDKLTSYQGLITRQLIQQFMSIISTSEWMEHGKEKKENQERMELKRLVEVLFRVDALTDVVTTYRDQLTEEIKVVVKTVVTETIAMSNQSNEETNGTESKITTQLRALSSSEFLKCVNMIFEHLRVVLEKAVLIQQILTQAMQQKIKQEETNGKDPIPSANTTSSWTPPSLEENEVLGDWKIKTKCTKVIREMDEVVRKTCEFSQRSVSNLFAVRKEVQAIYTMRQLRLLYDTTMEFVLHVEKVTTKTDYTLRGALFTQLKCFLEKYHQQMIQKLVSTLDHELWKTTEISHTRHQALEDLSSGRGVSLILSEDREVAGEMVAPVQVVSVCGKSFRCVWSVLLMLEIVMNYMSCAANFPVLATDVLQRTIEIFRLYNSRTTQLVLGAGAMQIARLKSISTSHLALASQSLDLTMTLIPHIKAALAAHFTDRQKLLLEEMDRVIHDYAEHNEKIFSKFTNIVEEQIMKRYLEQIEMNYDGPSVVIPTKPFKGIVDATLKLHGVLQPILSFPQMKDIMTPVFDMFTNQLPECFKVVHLRSSIGKQRVIEDIEWFVKSFHEVSEVSFHGESLLRHFKHVYHT